jgi:uncharacterized protein
MSYYGSNARRTSQVMATPIGAQIDAGLRAHMQRVYGYMAGGLVLTGIVAYVAAASGFYQTIADTGLIWIVMLAPLGFVLALSFGIQQMSAETAMVLFWIYAAVMGLSLGSIFLVFTGTSIARVFFITAATYGAMSLYGYTTRSDLSGFGSFLLMGLIGLHHSIHRKHLCGVECPSARNLHHRRLRIRRPDRIRHATYQGNVS